MTDSNARTMSIIARGLCEPHFMEELKHDMPLALQPYGVCREFKDELDVHRLALFSGFIATVKSPCLWSAIPRTLDLLSTHNLLLPLFAEYWRHANERPKPPTQDRTIMAFASHLAATLRCDANRYALSGIRSVFRHEMTLWRLQQARPIPAVAVQRKTRSSTPIVRGAADVKFYANDPRSRELACIASGTWLLYWKPPSRKDVRIRKITPAIAAAVRLIDGRRSSTALVRQLQIRLPALSLRQARSALQWLNSRTIISL
jgi:hypothetical protein